MKKSIRGLSNFTVSLIIVVAYLLFLGIINITLLLSSLPEIIGACIGILLGFGFTELINDKEKNTNRKALLQNLKAELEKCLELVKMRKGHLLPTAIWRATLSTGDLSLLPFDQRRTLSSVFTIIENQNYESTQVKNASIAYNMGMTGTAS